MFNEKIGWSNFATQTAALYGFADLSYSERYLIAVAAENGVDGGIVHLGDYFKRRFAEYNADNYIELAKPDVVDALYHDAVASIRWYELAERFYRKELEDCINDR